jgi:hypothetical protein
LFLSARSLNPRIPIIVLEYILLDWFCFSLSPYPKHELTCKCQRPYLFNA